MNTLLSNSSPSALRATEDPPSTLDLPTPAPDRPCFGLRPSALPLTTPALVAPHANVASFGLRPSARGLITLALTALAGVGGFHLAWLVPPLAPLVLLLPLAILQLSALRTPRFCFYAALALGLACYAPHLHFFWTIFGPGAAALWIILAAWLGVVAAITRVLRTRLGPGWAALAFPFVWTAAEFFRSELYYLRFSWLSLGYTFSEAPELFTRTHLGLYGVGFLVAALAALAGFLLHRRSPRRFRNATLALGASLLALGLLTLPQRHPAPPTTSTGSAVRVAALQLEYPTDDELLKGLDRLARRHPHAQLVVLSEYTLQGPPPPALLDWCREHRRYLVVGGKDPIPDSPTKDAFRNTAFVVDPTGMIVFRQVKSVPIQFFQDGEHAREQSLWPSPWGPMGLAICYDLSYRSVMDTLVYKGAHALVIPTADESTWGAYQHQLHTRVARVRAAEYQLPILRVAGSGISQFVGPDGVERASAPFPGPGETLAIALPTAGPGRVPLDRWLAPAALVATLGFLTAAFAVRRVRGRRIAQTPTRGECP